MAPRITKTKSKADDTPEEKAVVSKTGIITIPGVKTQKLTTLIIGTAPLICHKFSQKYRDAILAKHMGEASGGREAKVPLDNFNGARYRLTNGSDGIPAAGLKAGIVDGFGRDAGVFVSKAKGGIRVQADDLATNLVRLLGPPNPQAGTEVGGPGWPLCREDVVRNETGVVDIRHRPEYWPWGVVLNVEYLPAVASQKQVLQAIAKAGFTVGHGEWRPSSPKSKSGTYGTWRLASAEEVKAYEDGTLFADFEEEEALRVAAE